MALGIIAAINAAFDLILRLILILESDPQVSSADIANMRLRVQGSKDAVDQVQL